MNKEIEIPEGHEARIEDNKVIIEPKENNDEKIRKALIDFFKKKVEKGFEWVEYGIPNNAVLAYLEKQKERFPKTDFTIYHALKTGKDKYQCTPYSFIGSLVSFSNYKNLIDFLHNSFYTEEDCKEWIEKQKEQKPAEWSEEDEKMLNNCVSALKEGANGHAIVIDYGEHEIWLKSLPERFNLQPKQEWSKEEKERIRQNGRLDVCYNPEKYGLCHKTEWGEGEMKALDSIIDDYEKAAKSFCGHDGKIMFLKAIRDGEYGLSKQEWSEEDKVMLSNIIWGVHMKSIKPLDEMDDRSKYERYEDFLKALPERFNLQPRTEWSEEDKKRLESVIHRTEVICGGNMYGVIKEDINWLKSLRPQPHWKPSEEEICALAEAMERNDKIGYLLHQLHEELKCHYKL